MAALTALDLITEGLEEINAVSAGDTLQTIDTTKGLAVLNRLILGTNINRGNIFSERSDIYTLTNAQQSYTIGVDPAGILTPDLTGVRPLGISRVNLLMPSGSLTVRRKIRILTTAQWSAKSVQQIVGMPVEFYSDNGNPLARWYFYQIPDQAWQVEVYTWQQFAALAALTTKIQIPPGYYEYWLYALAIRLCGPFGRQVPASTAELFRQAREDVFALNAESPRISSNSDLPTTGPAGMYNWLDGMCEDGD